MAWSILFNKANASSLGICLINSWVSDSNTDITAVVYDENDIEVPNALTSPTTVTIGSDGLYIIENPDFDDISTLWKVEVTFSYVVDDGNGITVEANGNEVSQSTAEQVSVLLNIADNVIESTVSDGYISNATVFADANNNGFFDIGEASTTTDENGESLYLGHLLADSELRESLSEEQIRECFNYDYYTKNVDAIFNRVFK